jgi:hypothetical protein
MDPVSGEQDPVTYTAIYANDIVITKDVDSALSISINLPELAY